MTKTELKEYRKNLEKEYSDKDLEIESSLTYITIGALGFFLTINDTFIKVLEAKYKSLLVISLIFLFIAFVLLLIRKSKTINYDFEMMTFIDQMNPGNESQDNELLNLWDRGAKVLHLMMTLTYISLSVGIGLQVLFLLLNLK